MAVAGMRTLLGARVAVRWHDGAVRVTVDDEAEAVAFALPVESGLALLEEPSGRGVIIYEDDTGLRLGKVSHDRGQTRDVEEEIKN